MVDAHWVVHVAPVAGPHPPFAHVKVADPVLGAVASVAIALAPSAVDGTAAEHDCPATVQLSVVALQFVGGTVHVVPVGAPQVPALQVTDALPVAGAVLSVTVWLAPLAEAGAVAEQLFAPTVQLMVPAAQLGIVQVALVALPHVPFEHAKLAEPVVGVVESVIVCDAPLLVSGTFAVHVFEPTVQFSVPAGQGVAGTEHVAPVGEPHVPFVHVNPAEPVAGATVSVAVIESPLAVVGTADEQVSLPTVHVSVVPVQSAGGGDAQVDPGSSESEPSRQV